MERFEQVEKSKKKIIVNNFIGGLAWSLGATVGIAVIITILGFIIKHVNLVPYVGNFVTGVIDFVVTKNPNLLTR